MEDEEFGEDEMTQSNQSTIYEEGEYEIIEGENGESEMEEIQSSQDDNVEDEGDKLNDMVADNQFGEKSFKELNVSPWLIANLETVGITKPTKIQEESLQHSLKDNGAHIIGCAHTGSGKTACFAIPIL